MPSQKLLGPSRGPAPCRRPLTRGDLGTSPSRGPETPSCGRTRPASPPGPSLLAPRLAPAPAGRVRLSPQLRVALGQGQAAGRSSLTRASSKGLHPRHLQRPVLGGPMVICSKLPSPAGVPFATLCPLLPPPLSIQLEPTGRLVLPHPSREVSEEPVRVPGALCRPDSPALSHGRPPTHCVQYVVTSLEWTPVNLQAHEFLEATSSPPKDTDQKQNKIEPNENNLLGLGQAMFPKPDARKLS